MALFCRFGWPCREWVLRKILWRREARLLFSLAGRHNGCVFSSGRAARQKGLRFHPWTCEPPRGGTHPGFRLAARSVRRLGLILQFAAAIWSGQVGSSLHRAAGRLGLICKFAAAGTRGMVGAGVFVCLQLLRQECGRRPATRVRRGAVCDRFWRKNEVVPYVPFIQLHA
jgi:hypothetical protein